MRKFFLVALLMVSSIAVTQESHVNSQVSPYIETSATVDSLVIPNRIYVSILLDEKDSKGRVSVEELEKRMASALKSSGIDLEEQLSLGDLGSDFSKYFLRKKEVSKEKQYQLLVYDAKTLSEVLINLENVEISNVRLSKIEYSKSDEMSLILKQKAVAKAKLQADHLVKDIGQKVGKAILISDMNFPSQGYFNNGALDEVIITGYSSKFAERLDQVDFKKIKLTAAVRVRFHLY